MVEHISNGTENMDEIAPFIILLVCLIVAHVVVTRLSKKENSASTSWFSKPIVDQTEDNKTEEESNPSPKSSSSVFHAAESEDTEDDTTYWTEKHDNSKTLFQEAILVQSPWECKQCTFINTSSKIRCEICGDSNGRVRRVSLKPSLVPSLFSFILFSVSSYLSHLLYHFAVPEGYHFARQSHAVYLSRHG